MDKNETKRRNYSFRGGTRDLKAETSISFSRHAAKYNNAQNSNLFILLCPSCIIIGAKEERKEQIHLYYCYFENTTASGKPVEELLVWNFKGKYLNKSTTYSINNNASYGNIY